jgi:hypothetical protein
MNEFEQRLRQTPLKPVPADWRAEILAAAGKASPPVAPASWQERLNVQLHALFWPHPKAWVGLAVVWILIALVDFSQRETSSTPAQKTSPPSPEVLVELREQRQLLAELIGVHQSQEADRPKKLAPQSKGESQIYEA